MTFACDVNNRKEYSPDIIYCLLDTFNLPVSYLDNSNINSPVDFAILTRNLEMIDNIFNIRGPISRWGYRAVLHKKHTNIICMLGDVDMYRKISRFPVFKRWNNERLVVGEYPVEKLERLKENKATALANGHIKLARLIQSIIEGREEKGGADPALQALPTVPPVENLERIKAGPRQLPTKPPAAPM